MYPFFISLSFKLIYYYDLFLFYMQRRYKIHNLYSIFSLLSNVTNINIILNKSYDFIRYNNTINILIVI